MKCKWKKRKLKKIIINILRRCVSVHFFFASHCGGRMSHCVRGFVCASKSNFLLMFYWLFVLVSIRFCYFIITFLPLTIVLWISTWRKKRQNIFNEQNNKLHRFTFTFAFVKIRIVYLMVAKQHNNDDKIVIYEQ